MGFLDEYKKQRKESKAFKKIVEKRTLQARRKAFEQESLKVAQERGRALARRKSTGSQLAEAIRKRVLTPQTPQKSAPTRVRTVKRKKKAKRVKVMTRKKAPIRKVQAPTDKPQVVQKPAGFEWM